MKIMTLKLTQQQLDDLASAVGYTITYYPKEGSTNFRRSLKTIDKKIWKAIREEKD